MAGVPAGLLAGIRLSDHISPAVIARAVPPDRVRQVLAETGRASERERDLPAPVMVYYAIALALYMGSGTREVLRCLLEDLRWLWGAEAVKVAGRSGISQARSRSGEAPLRRLYGELVQPVATRASKGAWYRDWRLVSLDGSCLDVADTEANRAEFGMPGASRGESAFPQLRFVALVEYRLEGVAAAEPLHRLLTTLLDPAQAPAVELAALHHERWEIEGAFAELKTQLRGARVVLRSRAPELVRQEVWGLLLAHFAIRGLMLEAALKADEDPDRLSFSHAVRVVRRKLPLFAALPPSSQARPAGDGAGGDPGRAGGERPWPASATRGQTQDEQLSAAAPRTAADHPHRRHRCHPPHKVNSIGAGACCVRMRPRNTLQPLPGRGIQRLRRFCLNASRSSQLPGGRQTAPRRPFAQEAAADHPYGRRGSGPVAALARRRPVRVDRGPLIGADLGAGRAEQHHCQQRERLPG